MGNLVAFPRRIPAQPEPEPYCPPEVRAIFQAVNDVYGTELDAHAARIVALETQIAALQAQLATIGGYAAEADR